ncbi:MAG: transposase [Chloroflexi bacterium]|nr:transposase [Chloroflexota bacterium]
MRKLIVPDAETVILALQDEIRRSEESRYDHRLHGILLVAQGMSGRHVADLLGDAPRTVAYWVRRFEEEGLAGLVEGERPGRPRRLSEGQLAEIDAALRSTPRDFGLVGNLWDGKMLAEFIHRRWSVPLGVRQCQRLFRRLDFRLRKPRPEIAKADPEEQARFKKTPRVGRGSRG